MSDNTENGNGNNDKLPVPKEPDEETKKLLEKLAESLSDEEWKKLREMAEGFFGPLPDEDRETTIARLSISYMFQGPIPPPHMLKGYQEIDREIPGEIMGMARTEQSMRDTTNRFRHTENTKRINGSTLSVLAYMAVAGIVAWQGAPLIALSMGGLAIVPALGRWLRPLIRSKDRDPDDGEDT